jgi:hypothetical protein
LGTPSALPAEEVHKWYERYHTAYGQDAVRSKVGS